MPETKRPSYLQGAAILAAAAILAKIIGAVFKIPLGNLLDDNTYSLFTVTYTVYSLLLTISYSGIPVAMSRLVSAAVERQDTNQARRYFRVALPAFAVLGGLVSALMFGFAPQLAQFMGRPAAALGIRVLSPAVFLCCVASVYEGYSQGYSDMLPTAIKQVTEVALKLVVGLAGAWFFINRGADGETVAAGAISGAVAGLAVCVPILMAYKRRRADSGFVPQGRVLSKKRTLADVFKVSVPITLGASCMSIITLLDTKVVLSALGRAGFAESAAGALHGVYAKALTLFTMIPALLTPVSVSVVPAIAAAIAIGEHKKAREVMESSSRLLCAIAAPAAVGLAVLGGPIYRGLFGATDSAADGGRLIMIFGIAAFFACTQLITTAMLQATGHERVLLVTVPVGGAAQLLADYLLVSDPKINISGSPVGTFTCYAVISALNFAVLCARVPTRPRLSRVLTKPVLLALVMGAAVWGVSGLAERLLGSARVMSLVVVAASAAVGVVVYLILAVMSRLVTAEDLRYLPKGAKIAKFLKL